ncbi:hypothetical protein EZV62_018057 [Acer yangbiense]|uniref:CCHC-type domain-containing protein n=1 Tax=Acer yangbiense TaxID=1000413 RepID=A0A5C7HIQ3_9ROSI|nr:hypothetical protein EZV62_018057 [Acer yangbiense]
MGTKELARLCENLSIKDEYSEIYRVSEGVEKEGVEDVDHCLVGKVLSGKRVNREAFNNPEDRNQIWRRGPWHFDRSLIVLVKPEGTGDISQLSFDIAEFWVQIHDIPIMCMNRRMAKWLAEQIGRVIEIPIESRECWGKFLRVKVSIDISKPLKRWLRLKLDKTENIVVVGLKYERLSEFCYVCGRIGHGINECTDGEAKKEAIEGSSVKEKSSEDNREAGRKETQTMELSSVALQKGGIESFATVAPNGGEMKLLEAHPSVERVGNDATLNSLSKGSGDQEKGQANELQVQVGSQAKGKKWKRAARKGQRKVMAGIGANPLQRKLIVSRSSLKSPTRSSSSFSQIKSSLKSNSGKKTENPGLISHGSPQRQSSPTKPYQERGLYASSKRKVNFEILEEERESKKGKATELAAPTLILVETAEPAEQARREP